MRHLIKNEAIGLVFAFKDLLVGIIELGIFCYAKKVDIEWF